MEQNELKHYGVPGMKWGVRKAKYTTVRQAYKNARVKEIEARKQELQNSKGKGMTARKAIKNMNKAGQAARRQSIRDDIASNRDLRAAERGKKAVEILLGKGAVIDKDPYPKSERQKKWEDNHGINPHRPNGTRNGPTASEIVMNTRLGKLDNNPVVQFGKEAIAALLDRDTGTKRD